MRMASPIQESPSSFESDLRVSSKWVIAVLSVLAVILYIGAELLHYPTRALVYAQLFLLLVYALSSVGWLLANRNPLLGQWYTVLTLIALIHSASIWLGVPEVLTLLVIPTALAAAMIGIPAAFVTAVGETLLCLTLLHQMVVQLSLSGVVVTLTAIWTILGVMYVVYRPVRQIARWSWSYFQRAQCLLEEARDRRAELEQVVDDLVHANRQLALANERISTLRLIAEEAQKAKSAFVAKVSHEFRTPLNMITGLVGLMVDTPEVYSEEIPSVVLDDLKVVQRNCEHLSDMVNDVLALSQAEAGRLTLHREWTDLARIVDGALAVVHPLLVKKDLGMQVVILDDVPQVYCDRTRIRQVILNLISNAARFTEEGGITVCIVKENQHVVVSVADTGPGISAEDAKDIFEPFCQGTGNLWRDKGGSGLGLSISKQFVELHGGRIWLESEPGVGSTFFFELPISPLMPHVARPGHWIMEEWVWVERTPNPNLPDLPFKERIVVCDETGGLCPSLSSYSDEVELVDIRNPAQVLQQLHQAPAHAVLFNTATPDGLWPLVDQVRRQIPDTPVIGCSVPLQTKRALKAGARDYLVKPVTRADLEGVIEAIGKPVKRILAVDDDADVLQLWTRMLRAYDSALEVVTASSGEQALEKMRSRPPDLVLLDVVMPDMNGWQVLECKSQDEAIRNVPVVLVSARDPVAEPIASQLLLVTMNGGLALSKLLHCSLELSKLLFKPGWSADPEPGPAPV